MKIQMIDGAIVIEPTGETNNSLTPKDFADKPLAVTNEPAFYVALGADGLMKRSVSVTTEDRKTVAALVGNWIAEGFQPTPCDIRAYAKHVRALAAANKPAKEAGEGGDGSAAPVAPAAGGADPAI